MKEITRIHIAKQAYDIETTAKKDFEKYNFKDTAYFEPFYLKEFIASTPKNKVF